MWDPSELRLDDDEVVELPDDIRMVKQPCYIRDCNGAEHDTLVGPGSKMTFETRAADDHVAIKRCGNPDQAHFFRDFFSDLNALCPHAVFHLEEHTSTCWKGRKNELAKPGQRKCRFDKPGALNETPHFDREGNPVLRRRHHYCGSYNPFMLGALRCNHDVTSMWGFGTKHMAVIMYITNYITKLNQKLLTQLPFVVKAAKQHQKSKLRREGQLPAVHFEADEEAHAFLNKVHYYLQRDVQLSMQTVVHTLAGFKERYLSHKPVKLNLTPFLSCLEDDDAKREHAECEFERRAPKDRNEHFHVQEADDGRRFLANARMDYELRPKGLDNCCLYDYTVCWTKRKRPRAKAAIELAEADDAPELNDPEQIDGEHDDSAVDIDLDSMFQFEEGHPQRDDWGVMLRRNHTSHFAVLHGPIIRNRKRSRSTFARQMLLLFKPYRALSELRADGQQWHEAFAEFEKTLHPRIRRLIENIEAMDDHRQAWEKDMSEQASEAYKQRRGALFGDEDDEEPDNAR